MSDSLLGKYCTILSLSIVYCFGSIILAATSFPGVTGKTPSPWGCFIGLILLAFGTGGIKPCVSSFGGDQIHSSQVRTIASFFAVFYFTINAGSVLSMLVTPILRSNIHCYGQKSCYPLAFGLPALLMIIATVIFVAGKRLYIVSQPVGNIVVRILGASVHALAVKIRNRSDTSDQVDHWLDRAYPRYDTAFIEDCKRMFKILAVFSPVCLFWALYDQQGSRWTYQAMLMSPTVRFFGWKFAIKPEQMGLVNAILILVMIPIFDRGVYPALGAFGFRFKPLTRMLTGMIFGAISFILAAMLQFAITSKGVFGPSPVDKDTIVCLHNCVHVLYQVPQYILLTAGEIMFSITGLEFAYSQAPASMKSVCQAAWLMTVALGNLVVIVFNELDVVKLILGEGSKQLQAWNFVFWTLMLCVGILLFYYLSKDYKYNENASTIVVSEKDNVAIQKSRTDESYFTETDKLLNE